ncbi:MAG: hypothetical protein WCG25_03500 [bacterium]
MSFISASFTIVGESHSYSFIKSHKLSHIVKLVLVEEITHSGFESDFGSLQSFKILFSFVIL